MWYYEVNNLNAIWDTVITFFKKYRFLSAKKKRDFLKFCQLATLLRKDAHLTEEGIRQVLEIRREMNDGGNRRYSDADILARFRESPETIRQTLDESFKDEIVRPA